MNAPLHGSQSRCLAGGRTLGARQVTGVNLRRIKVLGIAIPALGLAVFEVFRHFVLQPGLAESGSHEAEHVISYLILLPSVVAFAFFMFRLLERSQSQLVAVSKAGAAVASDLSVERVLERVAELAREVAGAAFASVEVWGPDAATVSSGSRPEEGPTSILPIIVKDRQLGQLLLAGPPRHGFPHDRKALETFATQAGIALENARLFEQVHELAATHERARIGMDLHDGLIQQLYALGLRVEDAADEAVSPSVEAQLRDVQGDLRRVIGEIRTYVYGLRDGDGSVDLGSAIRSLASGFDVGQPHIDLDLEEGIVVPGSLAAHAIHIAREALANALRHSSASRILVRTCSQDGVLSMCVQDDGTGFDTKRTDGGLGLSDMRERARWCGCELEITSAPGGGTRVMLAVPGESSAERQP